MNQPDIIIDESIDLRGIMEENESVQNQGNGPNQSCPNETVQNEPNQIQTEKPKQSKQEDETPKGEGTFKIFCDKYNVKAVIDLLTTLAKDYERKDEEKKTNVIDITDEKEETRQHRKPDQDKPNKAQEEKKQEKMTQSVSFSTRDIRFYEQDPTTEEYKPRYQTPADFMQPVKQRIHQPLWNISPQEGKKY